MAKSFLGLIEHCKEAVKNNVQYIYGAKMQVMNLTQIKSLQKAYGTGCVWNSDLNKAGKLCCDCSGLISSYTGIIRGSSMYKASALDCVSVATVKKNWKRYVGWAFWMQGHIGVVSDKEGYYYAMDGSARNMVHFPITKQNWKYAIKLCDIDYSTNSDLNNTADTEPLLSGSFIGVTSANLNIRKYANTSCDIVGNVSKGNDINVVRKYSDGWYMINNNGEIAYASASYIDIPVTVFNIKTAINKLEYYGCINTKEYWLNHYADIKYLDMLLVNIGMNLKKKSADSGITDLEQALKILESKGVINTIAYWQANVNKVQYLSRLILNAANALRD